MFLGIYHDFHNTFSVIYSIDFNEYNGYDCLPEFDLDYRRLCPYRVPSVSLRAKGQKVANLRVRRWLQGERRSTSG